MIPELLRQWAGLHTLLAALGLGIYLIGSNTKRQRRHPSAAIAWVVSLSLLPYVALPLYLLIGNRKIARGPTRRGRPESIVRDAGPSTPAQRFQQLATAMALPAASAYEHLAIHEDGGEALRALRAVIVSATRTLDLCTFLLGKDALGAEIAALLASRARDGVRVRLMIDGIGVYLGGYPDLKGMAAAGVQVQLFVSPLRSALPGRTNLRNHRKMVIADGARLWTGGRNLAAEYFVGDPFASPRDKPWLDLSFDLGGDLARQAADRFSQDWAFATGSRHVARRRAIVLPPPVGAPSAQLIASGPDQADDTVYSLLISGCFTAQSRITAVTPYFVPDGTLLMALTLAARRGVAVDLVIPRKSNHRLADMARHPALRDMADAGARIWLVPEMIHAKVVLIDDQIALAGSANLDERSLFLNYEMMLAFYDVADVDRFSQWIERQRQGAQPYRSHTPGALREFAEGLIRWLAFQL